MGIIESILTGLGVFGALRIARECVVKIQPWEVGVREFRPTGRLRPILNPQGPSEEVRIIRRVEETFFVIEGVDPNNGKVQMLLPLKGGKGPGYRKLRGILGSYIKGEGSLGVSDSESGESKLKPIKIGDVTVKDVKLETIKRTEVVTERVPSPRRGWVVFFPLLEKIHFLHGGIQTLDTAEGNLRVTASIGENVPTLVEPDHILTYRVNPASADQVIRRFGPNSRRPGERLGRADKILAQQITTITTAAAMEADQGIDFNKMNSDPRYVEGLNERAQRILAEMIVDSGLGPVVSVEGFNIKGIDWGEEIVTQLRTAAGMTIAAGSLGEDYVLARTVADAGNTVVVAPGLKKLLSSGEEK